MSRSLRMAQNLAAQLERIKRYIPLLFVVYAVPLTLIMAVTTPPFQVADEPAHFLRAYAIAHGGFVGARFKGDPAFYKFIEQYNELPFHAEARTSAAHESAARRVEWTGKMVEMDVPPETAKDPPIGYIPQVIGILVGESCHLSVFRTLRLARLFSLVAALGLASLALLCCRRGKFAMFSVLLLPMSLSLYASCNPDATTISVAALGFGLLSRTVGTGRPATTAMMTLIIACLFTVALMRPPYIALLVVLLVPGLLPLRAGKPAWVMGFSLVGLLMVGTVLWVLYAFSYSAVLGQRALGTSPKGQLEFVLHNFDALPVAIWNSLVRYFEPIAFSFVGNIGWLDTPFPFTYYNLAALALLVSVIAEATDQEEWHIGVTAILWLGTLGSILCLYISLYFIWNPIGNTVIEGMQGRYLIPLALTAAVGIPRIARLDWCCLPVAHCVVLFPLVTLYYVPQVIIERFYLAGG